MPAHHRKQHQTRHWRGSISWRLAMGSLALAITFSAFVVGQYVPGAHAPGGLGRLASASDPGASAPAADHLTADAASWSPQPAIYGTGSVLDESVTMNDGVVLKADVYFPTVAGTKTPANSTFPVLLQQTPYGKAFIVYAAAIAQTNVNYLVDRGYIVVIADVRGTGDSGGSFDLFDPVQATDGAALARWAAHLSQSNGEVGLFGESYMGINQFQTVEAAGAGGGPIKAMFPIIAGNDIFSDTVTQGGIPDVEFDATYIALLSGLNLTNPALQPLVEAASSGDTKLLTLGLLGLAPDVVAHSPSLVSFLKEALDIETGQGAEAFDGPYWAGRSPAHDLPAVVADHIPAFLVGGWNDLFESGEPLNYVGLQNLYDGRSQSAAMTPSQQVTARYQLLMGPWQHVTTGMGVNISALELEWFDTWLMGERTPLSTTTTPLHLNIRNSGAGAAGTGSWVDAAQWPLPNATPASYYFGPGRSGSDAVSQNDGSLTLTAPTSSSGSDRVLWTGVSSPCDIQTDQWGVGALALGFQSLGSNDPCDLNDVTLGAGPGSLVYTSAPFSTPEVVAGPIDATVYEKANTSDTELAATVEAVSPNGTSLPMSSGALLGSLRALDPARTWATSSGAVLLPVHPLTQQSAAAVVPGQLTRQDIAVYPTMTEVPVGWRLRVTVTTGDTPHLLPSLAQAPKLFGGLYDVQRAAGAASVLRVPLAPLASFGVACGDVCSPQGP
ncbi:MAG TPA: CocE/NonD family hydrolase [Acidimicrobiales bacterium]|nr:CocE/NonD family hydrolase [Acidimicrobiales bacterium]